MMKNALLCIFLISLFTIVSAQPAKRQSTPDQTIADLMIQYRADRGSLSRFYFVENSKERRDRFKDFHKDYLSKLGALAFDEMSTNGRVDYLLFKRDLEEQLYLLDVEERECEATARWTEAGTPIYELEKARRRGKQMNGQEVAKQLTEIEKAVVKAGKELEEASNFPRNLIKRIEGTIEGQKVALENMYSFYEGYDPQFTWWVSHPYKQLFAALETYQEKFKDKVDPETLPKDDGSGIIGIAAGRKELLRLLEYEMIPYSPEELVDIANKEFAWCDRELLKASKEMGFGDNWQAAQEKVKQSYVPAGQQPEAMLELYKQSIDFLKKHDLLTIPPLSEETWRMRMIPPERQLISPFFLGGEVLQISYPTDDMEHGAKLMSMRGNNPHFSRSTVHHELIAGHHLQGFMNRRYQTHRRFRTPFWTEGWALYWELLLWDMDFPRSPEDRIGMLFWRMHRCARIIFSLNYHLGEWTPQQCIDFLVDRVGHERANAEGEVRRSFTTSYPPLYQLAYMTGGMQFYALKKELVDSGQMTYKEFHDAVLQENSMPVEMVRAILTNQKLKKNFKSNWKFYTK